MQTWAILFGSKCWHLTLDYEAEEKVKGKKIKFIPLWKWLLNV